MGTTDRETPSHQFLARSRFLQRSLTLLGAAREEGTCGLAPAAAEAYEAALRRGLDGSLADPELSLRLIGIVEEDFIRGAMAILKPYGRIYQERPLSALLRADGPPWLSAEVAADERSDEARIIREIIIPHGRLTTLMRAGDRYDEWIGVRNLTILQTAFGQASLLFGLEPGRALLDRGLMGEVVRFLPPELMLRLPSQLLPGSGWRGILTADFVSTSTMERLSGKQLRPVCLPVREVGVHLGRGQHPYLSFLHDFAHLAACMLDPAAARPGVDCVRRSLDALPAPQRRSSLFDPIVARTLDGPMVPMEQRASNPSDEALVGLAYQYLFKGFENTIDDWRLFPGGGDAELRAFFEAWRPALVSASAVSAHRTLIDREFEGLVQRVSDARRGDA